MNLSRAKALMEREGVDGLVGSTAENIAYLTDFFDPNLRMIRGIEAYAVVEAGAAQPLCLILPRGDLDLVAASAVNVRNVLSYGSFWYGPTASVDLNPFEQRLLTFTEAAPKPSALEALADVLRDNRMVRVGVDEQAMPPATLAGLRAKLPDREFVPAANLLRQIRASKTEEEIERMKRATELELAEEFDVALIRQGARPLFTIIAFGRWAVGPNRPPGLHKLGPGELIRFDVGCVFDGYCSDISRTFSFGPPSATALSAYQAILNGEEAALAAVKPGVTASSVFEVGVEAVRRSGLPHYNRHHIGHGIGLEVFEPPVIGLGREQCLEVGMVLEVETPYYEPGFGGIQVEDTVVVTPSGCEMLTQRSRALVCVNLQPA